MMTENLAGLPYGDAKDDDNHLTGSAHLDDKHVDTVPTNTQEVNVAVEHTDAVAVSVVEPAIVETALDDVDTQQGADTQHELDGQHHEPEDQPAVSPVQHRDNEQNLESTQGVHLQPANEESHTGVSSAMPSIHLTTGPANALVAYPSSSLPNSSGQVRRRGAERYHPTSMQLKTLISSFEDNPCPSVATLNHLSASINMPMHNLVLWFKNKRARTKKNNVRIPGQRRSYVKSGIYSRARRVTALGSAPKVEHLPHPNSQPPVTPVQVAAPSSRGDQSHSDGLPEAQYEVGSQTYASTRPPVASSPHLEHVPPPTSGPSAKRLRTEDLDTGDGDSTLIPSQNTCRNWSSVKCVSAFSLFFSKHTGGQHQEQLKAAQAVATEFFMSEMQSGLTVSSLVQPIQRSLDILDGIIEKRNEQGLPVLNSGSRSILGEFIVQIRSGEASVLADEFPDNELQ